MEVATVARQRWRVAILLSAVVVALYFGLVLLIAFDKAALAVQLVPGLSLGILLGALVILGAWLTTWIYARWAARHFEPQVAKLRAADAQREAKPRPATGRRA